VHRRAWPTRRELISEVFEYIEAFYNRQRRHSTLGYLTPEEFENSTRTDDGARLAASRLPSLNGGLELTTKAQPCPAKRAHSRRSNSAERWRWLERGQRAGSALRVLAELPDEAAGAAFPQTSSNLAHAGRIDRHRRLGG
jgi:hypothetical protein